MKSNIYLTVLLLLFTSCQRKNNDQIQSTLQDETTQIITRGNTDSTLVASTELWDIQSIDGQNLVFANGKTINTILFDLDYFGQITDGSNPFVIVAGRSCRECDANKVIYVLPTNKESSVGSANPMTYPYPGKELDYENGSLINDVRFFFGEVLPKKKGAIWYQKTKLEDKMIDNAYLLIVKDGKLVGESLLNERLPDINLTLKLTSEEKAIEVPGKEYFSEP